ncbi:hypothetical protein SBOR_7222 [Sclerotinia borealis F-4128]|uniref:Uncharacterized protein n=1 Tax=Sclerotinia borealis (strain F-4128) TaxID=1432307 RepID=W9CC55_SCLBF|nr:hypothetical protein SBOR_7222 [Sclerotinia borealis F-4128]
MPTNEEILQEACDRVRQGKALTSKMKMLLGHAALERMEEMEIEASARAVAVGVYAGEKKKERRKKKLERRREEKKEEARNMGIDAKLAGGLSAVGLEGEGKEDGASRKTLYREMVGDRVLEDALVGGREMEVVICGSAFAATDEEQ